MSQGQIVCPNCQALITVSHVGPVQCMTCGQQFNLGGQYQQPMQQQPMQPMQQQPMQQQPMQQQPAYDPLAQTQQYPTTTNTGFNTPWQAAKPGANKSGTNRGLVIGICVTGGVALLAILILVVVLFSGGSDSTEVTNTGGTSNSGSSTNNSTTPTDSNSANSTTQPSPTPSNTTPNPDNIFGPSVSYAQTQTYQPRSSGLRYMWGDNKSYAVQFKYNMQIPGKSLDMSGQVTYTSTTRSPSSVMNDEEDLIGAGTGTGFVVRPDGYLVTCAHVVQGAVKAEVEIGGKTYPAKVVAMDTKNDLAIMRIPAQNLPYLPVFDSDKVRLAEEVRAFGFPLTTQLGESIKITRGTVSGINDQDGSKVFQLDVTVNPGNSGGPLMNEKGHVVGVVTALLAGDDIASMSFAVTSNDVRKLMQRYQLKFAPANTSDPTLSGPDLAENVTKSVGLIKVTTGPGGIGIAEKKVVQFRTVCSGTETTNGRRRSLGTTTENGVVLVDSTGEVSYCSSDKNLPGHLGLISMVGLQPLSDDESNEWGSARVTAIPEKKTVTIPTAPTSDPLSRYRFGRSRFGQPQTQTLSATRMHPAIEMNSYEISRTSGDVVDIKRKMELVTIDGDEDNPYMHVNGSGTFKFDKRQGIPQSLDFSATMAVTTSSGVARVPLKLSFTTLSTQQLAQTQADAQKQAAENQKRMQEAQARARELAAKRQAEAAAKAIPIVKRLDQLDLSE